MKFPFSKHKPLLICLAVFVISLLWASISISNAQNATYPVNDGFYYDQPASSDDNNNGATTDLATIIKNDSIDKKSEPLIYKIRKFFKLTWTETYDDEKPATAYITMIMNMALWLTSFISLILVIFAFYLIFFDKWEAWVEKAKKILTWVVIALVLMWLSWIIVSFFFEIYNTQAIRDI
jgi:hypothetical protein